MSNNKITTKGETKMNIQEALLSLVQRTDIDPDRLQKFLELQIKMEDRQAKREFQEALAGFQGDCPVIPKSKKVDFPSKTGRSVKYNYAPLDEIAHITKPHLKRWGLAYVFDIRLTEDKARNQLITRISHSGGHSAEFSHYFNPTHDDQRMVMAQRTKAASTFAKRSGLESALGIVTSDEADIDARNLEVDANEEQIASIESLIKNTKTDRTKLLKFLKVAKIEELSFIEAQKAVLILRQKRSK